MEVALLEGPDRVKHEGMEPLPSNKPHSRLYREFPPLVMNSRTSRDCFHIAGMHSWYDPREIISDEQSKIGSNQNTKF